MSQTATIIQAAGGLAVPAAAAVFYATSRRKFTYGAAMLIKSCGIGGLMIGGIASAKYDGRFAANRSIAVRPAAVILAATTGSRQP